jgi:hypothetical protein
MITINEFYRRARFVPVVIPVSSFIVLAVARMITGDLPLGLLSVVLLYPVWAGVLSILPYTVFLVLVPRYITPRTPKEWRRIEILTPLCITVVLAVAVTLYVGTSDLSILRPALISFVSLSLGFGYLYVAIIEVGLFIGKSIGAVVPDGPTSVRQISLGHQSRGAR